MDKQSLTLEFKALIICFVAWGIILASIYLPAIQPIEEPIDPTSPHQLGELEQCQSDLAEALQRKEKCLTLIDHILKVRTK